MYYGSYCDFSNLSIIHFKFETHSSLNVLVTFFERLLQSVSMTVLSVGGDCGVIKDGVCTSKLYTSSS